MRPAQHLPSGSWYAARAQLSRTPTIPFGLVSTLRPVRRRRLQVFVCRRGVATFLSVVPVMCLSCMHLSSGRSPRLGARALFAPPLAAFTGRTVIIRAGRHVWRAGCDTMHRALCPIGRWTLSLLWTTHCSYAFSSTASRSSPRRRRLSSCLALLAMHLLDWEAHRSQLQALLSIRAVLPASRCRYRDLRNLAKKTESMTVLENLPVPPKKRRAFLLASKKRSFMRTGN